MKRSWFLELAEGIGKIGINWGCLSRLDRIDEDMLDTMKSSRCKEVYYGIESGSPRVRKFLEKGLMFSNEIIIKKVKDTLKRGINPICSFMTGIPTETEEEFNETVNLAVEIKRCGAKPQLNLLTPLTGTRLKEEYKDKIIKYDKWEKIGFADIFAKDQHWLFNYLLDELKDYLPDYYLFKNQMPLNRFVSKYMKARKELSLESKSNKMFFLDRTEDEILVLNGERLRVDKSSFIELKLECGMLDEYRAQRNKLSSNIIFIQFKYSSFKCNIIPETKEFLTEILKEINSGYRIIILNPLPRCSLSDEATKLLREITLPHNCLWCSNLFYKCLDKIKMCSAIGDDVELKVPFEHIDSRNRIYRYFVKETLDKNIISDKKCSECSMQRDCTMLCIGRGDRQNNESFA